MTYIKTREKILTNEDTWQIKHPETQVSQVVGLPDTIETINKELALLEKQIPKTLHELNVSDDFPTPADEVVKSLVKNKANQSEVDGLQEHLNAIEDTVYSVESTADATKQDVGDLYGLQTPYKNNLVDAINSVNAKIDDGGKKEDKWYVIAVNNSSQEDRDRADIVIQNNDDVGEVILNEVEKQHKTSKLAYIELTAGEFFLATTISVPTNGIVLKGSGETTKILTSQDTSMSYLVDISDPLQGRGSSISGMFFVNNAPNGIKIDSSNFTVSNITISNFGDTGVRATGTGNINNVFVNAMRRGAVCFDVSGSVTMNACSAHDARAMGFKLSDYVVATDCSANMAQMGFTTMGNVELYNCLSARGVQGFVLQGKVKASQCRVIGASRVGAIVAGTSTFSHGYIEDTNKIAIDAKDESVVEYCKLQSTGETGISCSNTATIVYNLIIDAGNNSIALKKNYTGYCAFNTMPFSAEIFVESGASTNFVKYNVHEGM